MILLLMLALAADDEAIRQLRDKGVKITATSAEVGDCTTWTDDDFKLLAKVTHLKSLSFSKGLSDAALPLLAGLTELESLSTNAPTITDDGVGAIAAFKNLKILKFFHPGKSFSGAGLAKLATMEKLERLTVAGSLAFNDDGMAAVGKLLRLKEFRTWHAGQTLEGVKHLKTLTNLKSLTLGQRLAYKPPTTIADDTLPVLAELKSLETLELQEARLKREAIVQLKGLPSLKTLNLAGIDIAEADVEQLRRELAGVEIKWTKPNDVYQKRIDALFGKP